MRLPDRRTPTRMARVGDLRPLAALLSHNRPGIVAALPYRQ
ncbi:hypothetical protein [Solidesulfovibrio alcoholivorans]|nr:hypothetical protein [Solidesulfovibrio alcoholivorans]